MPAKILIGRNGPNIVIQGNQQQVQLQQQANLGNFQQYPGHKEALHGRKTMNDFQSNRMQKMYQN